MWNLRQNVRFGFPEVVGQLRRPFSFDLLCVRGNWIHAV